MKLKLKEDPKEWRKAVLFGALGVALLSSVLRWRQVLPLRAWGVVLVFLTLVSLTALMRPRWFRGYYRFSSKLAFHLTQFIGTIVLTAVFILLITPFGILLRVLGKDSLRLKRDRMATTYWTVSKESSPLDRLF